MPNIQFQFVRNLLKGASSDYQLSGCAFAPSNIALCKYWGKRDTVLNLPVNSSLSISLGDRGTETEVRCARQDRFRLNGRPLEKHGQFAVRLRRFLDLFRENIGTPGFEIRTLSNIPTAAGMASSASGFAALVLALDRLAGWNLTGQKLSMLARLGSGSAARSIHSGLVQWHAGTQDDGTDSFAERLPTTWNDLRVGILELSASPKPVGSREGMNRTVQTSPLYVGWSRQAAIDLEQMRTAIAEKDFERLGSTAEQNALAMHGAMLAAWPPLLYFQPGTVAQIHRVQTLRADGLPLYLTIDAGPNVTLLFTAQHEAAVQEAFPDVQPIHPFGRS